ncbi:MAG: hypothetical protein ABR600_03690 [Actinomycetota bacterium]
MNLDEGRARRGHNGNVRQFPPHEGSAARSRHPSAARAAIPPDRDPLGKMALFSSEGARPALGTFLVDCSSCRRETPVSPLQLMRSAFPFSLHLPLLRRYHSLMRCPACGHRTWVRVAWQP